MKQKIIETNIIPTSERPKLQVGDKLYLVDNRKSTFTKLMKIQSDKSLEEAVKEVKIFELVFGKEATKEIIALDLSVEDYTNLTFYMMSAITGKNVEELKEASTKNL